MDLVAVIMAGGIGTRFWPLSTEDRPKQFLTLFGDRSLLQMSFDRVVGMVPPERILILTSESLVDMVKKHLPEVPSDNVIGEPMRRDTAAAVCLGASLCQRRFGDPVILTVTADHLIEPVDLFHRTALSAARQASRSGALYTFGIRPTYPSTAYGYLELGARVPCEDDIEHYELSSFKEKPDYPTARAYLESNRYCWNSGMFVWSVRSILDALNQHLPNHVDCISRAVDYDRSPRWPAALRQAFEPLASISIDYGLMEKTRDVRCVAARFSWNDVGGWQALREFLPQDKHGNCYRGQLFTLDAHGNLVFCDDPEETVLFVGVEDLVAVRAGQRTLIAHKDRTEEIKRIIKSMEDRCKGPVPPEKD